MTKFFTALNPCSKDAGVKVKVDAHYVNVKDFTFYESLQNYADDILKYKRGFLVDYIRNTFHMVCLVGGVHHPLMDSTLAKKAEQSKNSTVRQEEFSSKGLLDFFIFPLLARKLISDIDLEASKRAYMKNLLACMVAIPLELIRDAAIISLTLLLAITWVPLSTIVQQFVAPAMKDLQMDQGQVLKSIQDDFTDVLVNDWEQKGDTDAAKHVRASAFYP